MKTVVIFVDSKSRDLMGDALIAHHLEKRGYRCVLESLEAWRACLGAWKPDFVLFNHLNASHLAEFSQSLRSMGVLTGILPNEGIFHVAGDLEYSSKKQFADSHCDRMLCWNKTHHDALVENEFCDDPANIITLGVPRFDFYSPPWKTLYEDKGHFKSKRPKILVNTNFPIAHFLDGPKEEMERFFSQWSDISEEFADYRQAVKDNHWGRTRFLDFLAKLIQEDRYEIIVRPHPRENLNFYLDWYRTLGAEAREFVHLGNGANITELILACDLEISCENCTTVMEAWIAGKPTIGLTFKKHPFFYRAENGALLPECDDPETLPALIDETLNHPAQEKFTAGREAYMGKWVFKHDGKSSERVAEAIFGAVENRAKETDIRLSFGDLRRAAKLRVFAAINEPYYCRLTHVLKHKLFGERIKPTGRYREYLKAVRPSEARDAIRAIRKVHPSFP